MNRATRTTAALLGLTAGLAGLEHGYFELRQGPVVPEGLMFASMGPPCQPEVAWHACEPALTVIPNLQISGILSIVVGLAVVVWSLAFVQRKHGGLVLMALSTILLLVGGGIFPPVIGFIAGLIGTRINAPLTFWRRHLSAAATHALAALWPWPLAIYLLWTMLGQWVFGAYFNTLMRQYGFVSLLLILLPLILAPFTAFAHDIRERPGAVLVSM